MLKSIVFIYLQGDYLMFLYLFDQALSSARRAVRIAVCLLILLCAATSIAGSAPGPENTQGEAVASGLDSRDMVERSLPVMARVYSITASPSGRYLAVNGKLEEEEKAAVYLFDLSGKESKVLGASYPQVVLQWLPDEKGIILGYSPDGYKDYKDPRSLMGCDHDVFFLRYSLDGKEVWFTQLNNCVEWKIIPDGSGIAATSIDNQSRRSSGEVRCRVKTYVFNSRKWHDVFLSRWTWPDKSTGNHQALHKKDNDWILSYHEIGPSDSRSYWVNLSSGEAVIGIEGDPLFEYSPDGRYVAVAGEQVCSAYCWPEDNYSDYGGKRRKLEYGKVYGELLMQLTHTDTLWECATYFCFCWSPDSSRLLTVLHDTNCSNSYVVGYRIYDIATRQAIYEERTTAGPNSTSILDWVGNDSLLAKTNSNKENIVFLIGAHDGKRRPVFIVKKWRYSP